MGTHPAERISNLLPRLFPTQPVAIVCGMETPLVCRNCNQPFNSRNPWESRRRLYCGLTCAASYNNRLHPKRRKVRPMVLDRKCRECSATFPVRRNPSGKFQVREFCPSCAASKKDLRGDRGSLHSVTKGQLFSKRRNWQSARSSIQKDARTVYQSSCRPQCCLICGYEKHFQVSHRRSVSSFPPETLVGEINSIENLIALCPNHHWEHDHGLLSVV